MTRLARKDENEELAAFTPKAPSQQPNAQGPVQKPGEPLAVTTRTIPPAEPEEPPKPEKPKPTAPSSKKS